jgi:hypothetical protein
MAKVSGLTCTVTVAGNNISNDVTSFSVDTPYGVQDVTGIDKSAMERIMLRADCTGTLSGVFNTTASMSHATFKAPGIKTVVLVYPGPATLTFSAAFSNYALSMGADGSLTWSVNYSLSSGTAAAWT